MSQNPYTQYWQLRNDLIFLNHGSFGACPTCVLEFQRQMQDELELDPIAFLAPERELENKLDNVRDRLAKLLSAPADCLAFVKNATEGVNAVVQSFPWTRGDQLIVTNHGYNACNNAAKYAAMQNQVDVVVARIPFPLSNANQVIDAIEASFTKHSRLLLVDHVTSPTGLVFPLPEIIQLAHRHNIRVLVDGAHAPGMIEVNLSELQADYYTANHHKWLCAPKVSGFLFVQEPYQVEVRPTVISHAANRPRPNRSQFLAEFDWMGTFDPTPLLSLPCALSFLNRIVPGGLSQLMVDNRRNTLEARRMIADALQIPLPAPDAMIGSLGAIPLSERQFDPSRLQHLKTRLYEEFRIELPVFPAIEGSEFAGHILRISMQAYNDISQINRLVDALRVLLQE